LAKIIDAISSRPRLWRGREKDFLKKFYRTPKIGALKIFFIQIQITKKLRKIQAL